MKVALSLRVTLVAYNSERWGKCSLRWLTLSQICLTRLPHYLSAPGDVTWRSSKGHHRQEYESHRRLQPLWSKSNWAHAKVNAMCLTVLIFDFPVSSSWEANALHFVFYINIYAVMFFCLWRCRQGTFHIVNNNYQGWEMYAIGGSENPMINSEGNRFVAPNARFKKEVDFLLELSFLRSIVLN